MANHDRMFMSPLPADSGRLRIRRAWEVNGDLSYQCRWPAGYPHGGLILVRTLSGNGRLELTDGRLLDCSAGTVVGVRPMTIRGYGCRRPRWIFWWLECLDEDCSRLPLATVVSVPALPGEANALMENVRLLNVDAKAAAAAAAGLSLLVRQWERHEASRECSSGRSNDFIINILTIMRSSLERPLAVSELARRSRLSAGHFRQVFAREVGMNPKSYYDHLRLVQAAAWLRETDMKLADIADRLGYSSQFHLSRAFQRRHGVSPAAFRPARAGTGTFARGTIC